MTESSFLEISSVHLYSKTVRARELEFWEKVLLTPTCYMSHVMCHVSHVTYHMSNVTIHLYFFFKLLKLIKGGCQQGNGSLSSNMFRTFNGKHTCIHYYELIQNQKRSLFLACRLLCQKHYTQCRTDKIHLLRESKHTINQQIKITTFCECLPFAVCFKLPQALESSILSQHSSIPKF